MGGWLVSVEEVGGTSISSDHAQSGDQQSFLVKCFTFLPRPLSLTFHTLLRKGFSGYLKIIALTPPFPGIAEHQASILPRTLFWGTSKTENRKAKLGWILWDFGLDLWWRKGWPCRLVTQTHAPDGIQCRGHLDQEAGGGMSTWDFQEESPIRPRHLLPVCWLRHSTPIPGSWPALHLRCKLGLNRNSSPGKTAWWFTLSD